MPVFKATKAALNLAARRDHRITNGAAWRDGLGGLAENYESRNPSRLSDSQIHALIAAACGIDPAFGLYVEAGAVTGARPSQLARLTVADIQANNGTPRLLMPVSRKGRNRKAEKRPVPITRALADKLAVASAGRAATAPLLLRADGKPWQCNFQADHVAPFAQAAQRAGVPGTTFYALRHSAVIRALLNNVPVRVVAATHDTSASQIERTYSAHIADFADDIARKGMLETPPPPTGKVVKLRRRRP